MDDYIPILLFAQIVTINYIKKYIKKYFAAAKEASVCIDSSLTFPEFFIVNILNRYDTYLFFCYYFIIT